MPRLDIYHNLNLLLQVQLTNSSLTIGRGKNCQVSLVDPEISRRHATVYRTGEGWAIHNEGRNGTRLNGVLLQAPAYLQFGDRFYIGSHALVFQEDDSPALKGEAIIAAPTSVFECLAPPPQPEDE